MKKYLIYALSGTMIAGGCTSEKELQNTINQEETLAKMSLEDKAHFVIGTGMEGVSGDDAVIGATRSLVPCFKKAPALSSRMFRRGLSWRLPPTGRGCSCSLPSASGGDVRGGLCGDCEWGSPVSSSLQ